MTDDTYRQELILALTRISLLASALLGGIVAWSHGMNDPWLMVVAVTITGFVAVLGLGRAGWWTAAAWTLLLVSQATLLAAAAVQGGLSGQILVFAPFPALMAIYALGRRGAFLFTVLSLVSLAALYVAQSRGLTTDIAAGTATVRLTHVACAVVLAIGFGALQERRWRAAAVALDSSDRLRMAMLGILPDMSFLVDPSGVILEAHIPESMGPLVVGDPAGRHIHDVLADEQLAQRVAAASRGAPSTAYELVVTSDGAPTELEARFSAHENGDVLLLVRDVSARKHGQRMREQFLATVSHELRTPLTSIHGTLGLLKAGAAGALPTSAAGIVELAHRNSDRLKRLIDDLLDVQKMESGRLELRLASHDLGSLLRAAVDATRGYADPLGVAVELVSAPDGCAVVVDDTRFDQIVGNLVSNAVKYSPHGEKVVVDAAAHPDRGRVRVQVTDRGPGIPEDFRLRVFDRFAQADGTQTREVGGTGLGLAICKRLVEAFGGEIGFDTSPDGTCFWFELPAESA